MIDGWLVLKVLGVWLTLGGITAWLTATWFKWLREHE